MISMKNKQTLVFSSPEHEVLKVRYCDQSLSVVRVCIRPLLTFALNNFSKTAGQILK